MPKTSAKCYTVSPIQRHVCTVQRLTSAESVPVFCRAFMAGFMEVTRAVTAICKRHEVVWRDGEACLQAAVRIAVPIIAGDARA